MSRLVDCAYRAIQLDHRDPMDRHGRREFERCLAPDALRIDQCQRVDRAGRETCLGDLERPHRGVAARGEQHHTLLRGAI